ncbi:hypothetical protein ACFLR1_04395 [Bacteroidota bacterium]
MKDKKTAHTETELVAIFNQNNIEEKFRSEFIAYYKHCFDELYGDMKNFKDDDFDEDDSIQASALMLTNEYIERYLELIAQGHGEEWAHQVADSAENLERSTCYAFWSLRSTNLDLAKNELLIHCKTLGGDTFFEKHYLFLVEGIQDPDQVKRKAKAYSEIFKREISMGKSEVYAHEYAVLMADGEYHEIYCKEFAFAYDKAINQNKSTDYAHLYADKYGDAVVNIKRRYEYDDEEEAIDFAVEKVNAYMLAWEYGKSNKLKDFQRFAAIYEHVHLNTYYADEGRPLGSKEEIDKGILERTLDKFNS